MRGRYRIKWAGNGFTWLEGDDIGKVPSYIWNLLVSHNRVDEEGHPKAIHYTMGGPWFDNYKDCEIADMWLRKLEEMEEEKEKEEEKANDQE
ncbi:uncharacterized protein A4U43_C08F18420 [Asparagus officinalis]|nr:uncharacterized protein A4U43_C08F18420 [Asparagus officinalis]